MSRMVRIVELAPSAPTTKVPVADVPSVKWASMESNDGVEMDDRFLDHY